MTVRVAAVRQLKDGLELVRFTNLARGFEVFTHRAKGESLASAVRPDRFNFHGGVRGHGTRLLAPVIENETEARRHTSFKHGDFDKPVAEVHEKAVVWSAFDFAVIVRVSAEQM